MDIEQGDRGGAPDDSSGEAKQPLNSQTVRDKQLHLLLYSELVSDKKSFKKIFLLAVTLQKPASRRIFLKK